MRLRDRKKEFTGRKGFEIGCLASRKNEHFGRFLIKTHRRATAQSSPTLLFQAIWELGIKRGNSEMFVSPSVGEKHREARVQGIAHLPQPVSALLECLETPMEFCVFSVQLLSPSRVLRGPPVMYLFAAGMGEVPGEGASLNQEETPSTGSVYVSSFSQTSFCNTHMRDFFVRPSESAGKGDLASES